MSFIKRSNEDSRLRSSAQGQRNSIQVRTFKEESEGLKIFDIMDGEQLYTGPVIDKKAKYGDIQLPEEEEHEDEGKKKNAG